MNLSDRLRELNDAAADMGICQLVDDPAHWHEMGIMTGAELDAYLSWQNYCELYKDTHGIKPRWTGWQDKTAAMWDLTCHDLLDFRRQDAKARIKASREEECVASMQAETSRLLTSEASRPLTYSPFANLRL